MHPHGHKDKTCTLTAKNISMRPHGHKPKHVLSRASKHTCTLRASKQPCTLTDVNYPWARWRAKNPLVCWSSLFIASWRLDLILIWQEIYFRTLYSVHRRKFHFLPNHLRSLGNCYKQTNAYTYISIYCVCVSTVYRIATPTPTCVSIYLSARA